MPGICYLPPDSQATGPFSVFSSHTPTQTPSLSPTAPAGPSLALDPLIRKTLMWLALALLLIFILSCPDLVVASSPPSYLL